MQVDYPVTVAREEPASRGAAGTGALVFEDFYALEFERVYCATYAFCGRKELALDATQEAFIRAFARWNRLAKEAWVTGWVMTTAFNQCRRQTRSSRPAFTETRPVPAPTGDRVDLMAALRTLAPRQRTAALLFYLGDFPVRVVAEVMGVSDGAVKAHLSKAREALRARLADGTEGSQA